MIEALEMNTNVSPLKTDETRMISWRGENEIRENDKSELELSDDDVSIIKYQL